MSESMKSFAEFAVGRAPFRSLEPDDFEYLLKHSSSHNAQPGTVLLEIGDDVDGLYVLTSGNMELKSPEDEVLQHMYAGDVFGHRSLLRGSGAIMRVVAKENSSFVIINADAYRKLMASNPVFASFFSRTLRPSGSQHGQQAITPTSAVTVGDVMTRTPIKVHLGTSIRDCAELMAARNVSCMLVTDEDAILKGILTSGDLVKNVIVGAVSAKVPIEHVMTTSLTTCRAEDTVMRAIITMTEKRIAHLPVTNKQGKLVGIVTQTDLVRRNSNSLIFLINNISKQTKFDGLASIVARKPLMLAELVGSGAEGHQILRLMTSISDAITKRLIQLAIEKLGEPPVSWLWMACGSQGRQEQTGVSDQDNCLVLGNDYEPNEHGDYFRAFAQFVSDGLDACGYYYCPGDMMATNERWRQKVSIWESYFASWIAKPDPMAQMLASVMFDLRAISGDASLFNGMQQRTLERASKDSIFRNHMIANSLKHTVPVGLFGGLTYVRDKKHKNAIDMKHSGVVPVTDLARAYALQGAIADVNTRDRLIAARNRKGILSKSGGDDVIDAYDLLVDLRLKHQAQQVRDGKKPDNYLVPDTLSALERSHLKDAFSVIKTLQSAAGYGRP